MKITQLMLAKGFGGAERLFVDLSLALSDMGCDVLNICHSGSASENILKNNKNIEVRAIKIFNTRDPFAWRTIKSAIHEHKSVIVQSHLSRGTFLAGQACKRLGIPLVVTLHNYIDLKYYQHVSKFIPATKDQVEYLLKYGVEQNKIEMLPHFSHLDAVKCILPTKNNRLTIVSFGRMVEKKGFHILLKAFRKLIDSNIEAILCIGGDGPERESLQNLCQILELNDHVKFHGWIDCISSFLANADIFVLPSLDEPFGIIVLEAMAMGKPIISTLTQGPKEILNDQSAYLVEVGDVDSLTASMISAAMDKNARDKKANISLETYKNNYSKDVIVPRFIRLYESVLSDF